MSTSFSDQIEQAMQRLREHQEKMTEVTTQLQASTASVTSKDRMVTAKVGPQGQVVSLTFHNDDYRAMAPAELAAALVDVLNRARADMGERIAKEMAEFAGFGEELRASMVGGTELDDVLAPLYAMRPQEAARPVRITARQETFDE